MEAVTAAMAATQNDLDTVAACAGLAIDAPSKAVMPAQFAVGRGGTYPSTVLPAAPVALPGTTRAPPPPVDGPRLDPRFFKDRIKLENTPSISELLRRQG
jgi:hypothetical protein